MTAEVVHRTWDADKEGTFRKEAVAFRMEDIRRILEPAGKLERLRSHRDIERPGVEDTYVAEDNRNLVAVDRGEARDVVVGPEEGVEAATASENLSLPACHPPCLRHVLVSATTRYCCRHCYCYSL
jgi:hypothetical protein